MAYAWSLFAPLVFVLGSLGGVLALLYLGASASIRREQREREEAR